MTIWSHPPDSGQDTDGIELFDHLEEVATEARNTIPGTAESHGVALADIASVAGWCHDLGKASGYFQDHLDGENPPNRLRYHAPFGAVVAFYVGKQRGWHDEPALLAFLSVAKHHGSLPDVVRYVDRDGNYDNADHRLKQLDSIRDTAPDILEAVLRTSSNGSATIDGLADEIESTDIFSAIEHTVRDVIHTTSDALSNEFYEHALLVWSSLVVADKLSAAQLIDSRPIPTTLANETITDEIDDLQDGVTDDDVETLNDWRDKARDSARQNASLLASGGVATLTLPTGYGKTLAGVSAALDALNAKQNSGRLIYTLPYTSIIDQTAATFKDIFSIDESRADLTIHHYLSDTVTTPLDEPDTDTGEYSKKAYLLGETWESASVITTYVQLLESIAGPRNNQALKLPALENSVIILDEPQSIPTEWWCLVKRLISILTTYYNCSIIAMTATQPALFTDDYIDPNGELIDNPQQYFDTLSRVTYEFHDSVTNYTEMGAPLDYASAADTLADSISTYGSTLAICNTIASTEELYRATQTALQNAGKNIISIGDVYTDLLDENPPTVEEVIAETKTRIGNDGVALAYITTHLRPTDRQCIIDVAEQLATDDAVPFGLISTQVVEAGVDISFARVYRDLGPMDSIVQAAGRCNRSFEYTDGVVTVWWLDAPTDNSFVPVEIYSRWSENLPKLTVDALTDVGAIDGSASESRIAVDAVDHYYDALAQIGVGDTSYPQLLDDADGTALSSKSLLGDDQNGTDLIVCRTNADMDVVTEYREALSKNNFTVADQLKQELNLYRVSITHPNNETPQVVSAAELLDPDADPDSDSMKVVAAQGMDWYHPVFGIDG